MLHLEPLHTPSQEPAPKVKPKDSDRRHQHHRKRAAPAAAPAPTAIPPSQLRPSPGWRPPQPPATSTPLSSFFRLSCLCFFLLSFSLSWLNSPAPGLRVPQTPD